MKKCKLIVMVGISVVLHVPLLAQAQNARDAILMSETTYQNRGLLQHVGCAPKAFMDKFYEMEKDIEIVIVGDSISGKVESAGYLPLAERRRSQPTNRTYSFPYLLYKSFVKNEPNTYRLDTDFFTKVGTWKYEYWTIFYNSYFMGEWSSDAATCRSNGTVVNTNLTSKVVKVDYVWDMGAYEKSSLIYSLVTNGTQAKITLAEGNGKVLCSLDKVTWVEANNYELDLQSNKEGKTDAQLGAQGTALLQRHRRLWMKSVAKAGNANITVTKLPNDESYLYLFGADFWNGNTVFLTNIGRGGRSTKLLDYSKTDISDRNPDLVIWQMPIGNDSGMPLATMIATSKSYLYDIPTDAAALRGRSLQRLSNDFQKFQCIVVKPHNTYPCWDGDDGTVFKYAKDYPDVWKCNNYYTNIVEHNTFEGVVFTDVGSAMYEEIHAEGKTIQQGLESSGTLGDSLTSDGAHLNKKGAYIFAKYLIPLFRFESVLYVARAGQIPASPYTRWGSSIK